VDELLVRGLAPHDARLAAAALEARLAELAASAGAPRARAEAFRRAPAVDVAGGSPAALGEAVAGAVWAILGRRSER
jgi:hypothetical protein